MAETLGRERELIDDEVAVLILTWEDQQRRRHRILRRLRQVAERLAGDHNPREDVRPTRSWDRAA
jgi:hypothetical protein